MTFFFHPALIVERQSYEKIFFEKCKFWTDFSTLHFIWFLLIFQFLVNALPNRMMTSPYEPKMGPQKWYARTPRRLGCTTQSTWNYLCFIWLSHIFQLDCVRTTQTSRSVFMSTCCNKDKIDATISTKYSKS